MKREILFRAWDKVANKYWYDVLKDMGEVDYYDDGLNMWDVAKMMNDGDDSRFDFEQFTGLLDKNGVKIFEGDVVTIRARYDSITAPVVGHGTAWKFKVPVNSKHENPYRQLDEGWYGVEVVGNIHDKES